MSLLGVISGTIIVERSNLLKSCKEIEVKNNFGKSFAMVTDRIILIPRHGNDPNEHIMPHSINHRANLQALYDLGAKEVIGIHSTGSLKKILQPGMIVIPDDFITLTATPSIHQNKAVHITPSLDETVRQKLIRTANHCGIQAIKKGIYWQTPGPRLETKAEIAMMANYADIVGMTMASEAVVALELGLPFASVCSIDNFGNGISENPLTMEEIVAGARKNADLMIRLLQEYLEISF